MYSSKKQKSEVHPSLANFQEAVAKGVGVVMADAVNQHLPFTKIRGSLAEIVFDAAMEPIIKSLLTRYKGNQVRVSEALGLNRNTVRALLLRLEIDALSYKDPEERQVAPYTVKMARTAQVAAYAAASRLTMGTARHEQR